MQILIFRMLRNNADVCRCSYFEIALPVVLCSVHDTLNILLYAHISKASNLLPIFQIYLTRVT